MKHYIGYGSVVLVLLIVGFIAFRQHEAAKDAKHQEEIQRIAADNIIKIQAVQQEKLKELMELAKQKATPQSVTQLLPIQLPGQVQIQPVGPEQKPTLVVTGDPQANLQAIQDAEVKCAKCRIDLDAA